MVLYGALWCFMVLYGALWCFMVRNATKLFASFKCYYSVTHPTFWLWAPRNYIIIFRDKRREIILLFVVIGAAKLYYYLW